ncbi:MAG: radical SAM protein [bacterium]|nr:radical SAM protein [bacterium]
MIKHVFGPVPSRRLGISLGVDIIPFKTCTLDCIYCECGKSTDLTVLRKTFVDPAIILDEIEAVLKENKHIDHITFSGAGEPTLHKDIGDIIRGIKKLTPAPIAVLTNATLFYLEDVRRDLAGADLVLPSLDAVSPAVFAKINRPHESLDKQKIIEGLITFSQEFKGKMWLEVFIARDVNDCQEELDKIYSVIKKINPDRVQLNSLDRPPAYENVLPLKRESLESIRDLWKELPVEIVKRTGKREEIASFSKNLENNILNTISRRPLTADDLMSLTGKNRLELFEYIDILEKEKKICSKIVGDKIFFSPVQSA